MKTHHITNGEWCLTCNTDAVTCQVCAARVCGSTTKWLPVPGKKFHGNICAACQTRSAEAPRYLRNDFNERDCSGVFDGNMVTSDADGGL